MVHRSDPQFVRPKVRVVLDLADVIDTLAAIALVLWVLIRGPYAWWWLLPTLVVGSAFSGYFIIGGITKTGGIAYVTFCFVGVLLCTTALWVWY